MALMVEESFKIVVAHTGARRAYAVPSIIENAGMLEIFYTDICASVGLGKLLCKNSYYFGLQKYFARLATRRLPSNLVDKTVTYALPNVIYRWLQFFSSLSNEEEYRLNLEWQIAHGNLMVKRGFGNATWLHSFLDEFPPLLIAARNQGLKVIAEIYILLSADRILKKERQNFPGWEPNVPDTELIDKEFYPKRVLLGTMNFALCPSEAVQNDLVENWGVARANTAVVPYGVATNWLEVQNHPIPGRLLFCGTADLRKGIQYLAQAAEKLVSKGRRYEFRVAGNVSDFIKTQPACRYLTFLGRVPRDKILDEFQCADLMVLPSLAEGSAGSTYEALAAGVPVVTTAAAGSVARDGMEGYIVAERDSDALADAIENIVEDRYLRKRMSEAARIRAKEYTWDKYGERLIKVLQSLPTDL